MSKPLVGVICSSKTTESRFATQFTGEKNLRAVCDVAQAMPIMFAGLPDVTDIGTLLSVVDGVLLTGARANVHPTFFNVKPNEKHEPYDTDRPRSARIDAGVCRNGQACLRLMPRYPGDECGFRRHASSGNPRITRPHEPPRTPP